MARKTKEELKTLSDNTFYDNNNGEIQPAAHRTFNNTLIDSLSLDNDLITVSKGATNNIDVNDSVDIKDYGGFYILRTDAFLKANAGYFDVVGIDIKGLVGFMFYVEDGASDPAGFMSVMTFTTPGQPNNTRIDWTLQSGNRGDWGPVRIILFK